MSNFFLLNSPILGGKCIIVKMVIGNFHKYHSLHTNPPRPNHTHLWEFGTPLIIDGGGVYYDVMFTIPVFPIKFSFSNLLTNFEGKSVLFKRVGGMKSKV